MKRVVRVHGWEGYPEQYWSPWLKQQLEERGDFTVLLPAMPETDTPQMQSWVDKLTQVVGKADRETYLVGYSLGCIAILRYLETLPSKTNIGGAVLVAGFAEDLTYSGYNNELASFFTTPIPWDKLKKHCPKFVAINSDDDPLVEAKNYKYSKTI